jgi:exodeoxyribonuclease VII large subunit
VKLVGARRVFSVEEVSARLAGMFEGLRSFWVEAEIQDLRPSRSQVRFSLRGEHVLDASMNGIVYERLAHKPADGTLVHAYGRIEFWRARSQISMRVERLEPAGEGLLRAQVEELRRRLEAEGLMAASRKRRPPLLPRRVGLVTSAEGAARDDFLTNVWARLPGADVALVGVPVQGDDAPRLIARSLRHLDALPGVDVIVVARGGGSLEDLMAFNSEAVCRAVAASATPVVSAVGHERDVTLCDLVADVRVSTPSAAAAAVVPSQEALETHLADAQGSLARGLLRARAGASDALGHRAAALARALRGRGELAGDRVDRLEPRLRGALGRIAARAPADLEARGASLERAALARSQAAAGRVERAEALLALLSPARTVARGYAIVRDAASDRVLAAAAAAAPGQDLSIEMRDGRLAARAEGGGP